ncbi:hypothetical protein PMAC_000328 [Pneumocystis sp. 'macacae']|nr:hypothetical protein PMAC_000328 [Pneumocystis sp. 'macacae']
MTSFSKATALKTSFAIEKSIEPIYTGGSISLSADGYIFSSSLGEDVKVINIDTGEKDSEIITSLVLVLEGTRLITASRSLMLRHYEIPSGDLIYSLKAHDAPIIVMESDITSTLIATGGAEGTVKVWDIKGGYITHQFKGHGSVISAIRFSTEIKKRKDRWLLATAADDYKIKVWDLIRNCCLSTLDGHISVIRSLDFSDDEKILVSGSRDMILNFWDLDTFELKKSVSLFESIESVQFLKKGLLIDNKQLIVTGGSKNTIRFWDYVSGLEVNQISISKSKDVTICEIIYNTKRNILLSILSDHSLVIHSLSSLDFPIIQKISGYYDEIIDCTYIGNDESHIAIASNSRNISVVDCLNLNFSLLEGHRDIVICLAASKNGQWLASGSKDNEARLWKFNIESSSFVNVATFTGHTDSIGCIALSSIKKSTVPNFLLTGSHDQTIKLWNLLNIEESYVKSIYTRKAHEKDINALDISYDDKIFVSASQDKVCKVWDLSSGKVLGVLKGHKRGIWSVKISDYEKIAITGSSDKLIKLWNLIDYSCLKTFEGHTNSILKVLFISSGQQIISSGSDGLVKLWTIKTSECVTTLDNHTDRVWSLCISMSENIIISGGADSVINFWKDVTQEEKKRIETEKSFLVENEQQLSNYIQCQDWKNAIILAISLNHPYRLFMLFKEILSKNIPKFTDESVMGLNVIDEILESLSLEQFSTIINRLRDWNTNFRTAYIAQRVLYILLRAYDVSYFLQIPNIKKNLDAIIPYSERHYKRVSGTFFQPDEYWQSLEPAHQFVYGYGYLTWEWREGVRDVVHPAIFSVIYWFLKLIKYDSPYLIIICPKLLQATFAAISDFYAVKLSRKLYGRRVSLWTLFVLITSPFSVFFGCRTFSNTLEVVFITCALYYWPLNFEKDRMMKLRLSFVFVFIACILRPTNIIVCVFLLGYLLLNGAFKAIFDAFVIGSASFLFVFLLNFYYYGKMTFPLIKFLKFNLIDGLSVYYGSFSWHYYFSQGLPMSLFLYLPFCLHGIYLHRNTIYFWLISVVLFCYSMIQHKEVRFIYFLTPLLYIFSAKSISQMPKSILKKLVPLILIINVFVILYVNQIHQRGVIDVMRYIRNNFKISSVIFLMPCHSTPWQSYVHRPDVQMRFLTCEPPINFYTNNIMEYKDEAQQFYDNPSLFLQKYFIYEKINSTLQNGFFWPSHFVFFENLISIIDSYISVVGYRECARFFNSHFNNDWRRRGDVIVYCKE